MQHPMKLRGIIKGIVFELDMQFGAYSAILAETTIPFAYGKVTFICAHVTLKFEDTGHKNTLI